MIFLKVHQLPTFHGWRNIISSFSFPFTLNLQVEVCIFSHQMMADRNTFMKLGKHFRVLKNSLVGLMCPAQAQRYPKENSIQDFLPLKVAKNGLQVYGAFSKETFVYTGRCQNLKTHLSLSLSLCFVSPTHKNSNMKTTMPKGFASLVAHDSILVQNLPVSL